MKYEKARAEVILLSNEDIIRTSCGNKNFDGPCEKPSHTDSGNGKKNLMDDPNWDANWLK